MRPHQPLAMAFPAARFTAPAADAVGLRIPAELTGQPQPPAAAEEPEPQDGAAAPPPPDPGGEAGQGKTVELDRVVPPSGNLWIAGQQVWLGPAMTGRTARLWAGLGQVHVLLDGHRIKTLPSRLDARDLVRLAAAGAQAAGPPPLPPAAGDVTEGDRTVNASGNVSLGDHVISAGLPLAGQRVTLRFDGPSRPRPGRRRHRPHRRLPRPARGPAPAARRPPRNRRGAPPARTAGRRPARLGPRSHHGRRAEDPGRPGPRPQNRSGHRRTRHLRNRRRARHRRHLTPDYQSRHQAAQGLQLRLASAHPPARFAWTSAISAFRCSRTVSPVRPRPAASAAPAGPPASMTPSSRCSVPM
jgi:hypothetical protein